MSFQKLNQVTRPFSFPYLSAMMHYSTSTQKKSFFIIVGTDSGYWKVVADKDAREILKLFTLDGKRRWKVMPMGALNTASTFVAMMKKLKMECDKLAKESRLKNSA